MVDRLSRRQANYLDRGLDALEALVEVLEDLVEQRDDGLRADGAGTQDDETTEAGYPFGVETSQEQVTVNLGSCTLPTDEDKRGAALAQMRNQIRGSLTKEAKFKPDDISTTIGHQYAQVEDECPDCGGKFDLTDYTYTENGATAKATCRDYEDCGWQGTAVYQLADLVKYGPEGGSEVKNGTVSPSYIQY